MLVLAVAELFASRLFRSIVIVSLSKHLLSSLVCWCSAFCHITAACVSGKIHYVIPVPLLFVARCTYQAMRQRHPQPIGGARSGWRRNARALRDDGKTKQNELAVRTLERRLALLDALSSLHHCNFYVHTTTCGGDVLRFTAEDGGGAHSHGEAWKTTIP